MVSSASRAIYESINAEQSISSLFSDFEMESIHLDFKEFPTHPLQAGWEILRGHLAKAFSGFSNADGGVLILGVKEDRATPANRFSLKPNGESLAVANKVQENVSRLSDPPNHLIEAKRIAVTDGGNDGYVVIHIPKSEVAPHQNVMDKKYYQRSGESHLAMAHFQIADLFGRRPQPELKAILCFRRDPNDKELVSVDLKVKNAGKSIAKFAFIQVETFGKFQKKQHYSSWFVENVLYRRRNFYTAPRDHVLHPLIDVPVWSYQLPFQWISAETVQASERTFAGLIGGEASPTREFSIEIPWGWLLKYKEDVNFEFPDIEG